MVPALRGYSLQTRGFSGLSLGRDFPGFHREFMGVWAPNGHPDGCEAGRRSLGGGPWDSSSLTANHAIRMTTAHTCHAEDRS
jgi:hypothetical protein